MRKARQKQINEFADTIRMVLKVQIPVDVENAVKLLGGCIRTSSDLPVGVEAKIQRTENSFEICMCPETQKNKNRRRFSIAHELGHLFLHMGYLVNEKLWNSVPAYVDGAYYRFGYSEEEREAHEFAGALLMPEKEFKEIARKNLKGNLYSLQPIANHFAVSVDAVKVRGSYLEVFNWE